MDSINQLVGFRVRSPGLLTTNMIGNSFLPFQLWLVASFPETRGHVRLWLAYP